MGVKSAYITAYIYDGTFLMEHGGMSEEWYVRMYYSYNLIITLIIFFLIFSEIYLTLKYLLKIQSISHNR